MMLSGNDEGGLVVAVEVEVKTSPERTWNAPTNVGDVADDETTTTTVKTVIATAMTKE